MKIKHLLTAIAVFGALSVTTFAASDSVTESDSEAASDSAAGSDSVVSSVESKAEDGNVDTGIGGVAAVVGIITLAGAAVVISRKKS